MTITVLGIVGNQVRFGIDAPRDITVDRGEIHAKKLKQRGEANGNVAAPAAGVEGA